MRSPAADLSIASAESSMLLYPTLTLVSVLLTLRASATWAAPSAPREFHSKLQKRVEWRRQRALTVGKGRQAAYLSDVRVPFLARPSEMYFAPSSPSLLTERLQTRLKRTRQRA